VEVFFSRQKAKSGTLVTLHNRSLPVTESSIVQPLGNGISGGIALTIRFFIIPSSTLDTLFPGFQEDAL
jgi:hypothetical protein